MKALKTGRASKLLERDNLQLLAFLISSRAKQISAKEVEIIVRTQYFIQVELRPVFIQYFVLGIDLVLFGQTQANGLPLLLNMLEPLLLTRPTLFATILSNLNRSECCSYHCNIAADRNSIYKQLCTFGYQLILKHQGSEISFQIAKVYQTFLKKTQSKCLLKWMVWAIYESSRGSKKVRAFFIKQGIDDLALNLFNNEKDPAILAELLVLLRQNASCQGRYSKRQLFVLLQALVSRKRQRQIREGRTRLRRTTSCCVLLCEQTYLARQAREQKQYLSSLNQLFRYEVKRKAQSQQLHPSQNFLGFYLSHYQFLSPPAKKKSVQFLLGQDASLFLGCKSFFRRLFGLLLTSFSHDLSYSQLTLYHLLKRLLAMALREATLTDGSLLPLVKQLSNLAFVAKDEKLKMKVRIHLVQVLVSLVDSLDLERQESSSLVLFLTASFIHKDPFFYFSNSLRCYFTVQASHLQEPSLLETEHMPAHLSCPKEGWIDSVLLQAIVGRCHFYQGFVNFSYSMKGPALLRHLKQAVSQEGVSALAARYLSPLDLQKLFLVKGSGLSDKIYSLFSESDYYQVKVGSEKATLLQLIVHVLLLILEYQQSSGNLKACLGLCYFLYSQVAAAVLLSMQLNTLDKEQGRQSQTCMRVLSQVILTVSDLIVCSGNSKVREALQEMLAGVSHLIVTAYELVEETFGQKQIHQILEYEGVRSVCAYGMGLLRFLQTFRVALDQEECLVFKRVFLRAIKQDSSLAFKIWQDKSIQSRLQKWADASLVPRLLSKIGQQRTSIFLSCFDQQIFDRQKMLNFQGQVLNKHYQSASSKTLLFQGARECTLESIGLALGHSVRLKSFSKWLSAESRGNGYWSPSDMYFGCVQKDRQFRPQLFTKKKPAMFRKFSSYSCANGTRPLLKYCYINPILAMPRVAITSKELSKMTGITTKDYLRHRYGRVFESVRLKFGNSYGGNLACSAEELIFVSKQVQQKHYFSHKEVILVPLQQIALVQVKKHCQQYSVLQIKLNSAKHYCFWISHDMAELSAMLKRFGIEPRKGSLNKSRQASLWLGGKITNLDYMMAVNEEGARSYQNTSQFKFAPWTLNLSTTALDLNNYRDLSLSLGEAGEESKYAALKEKYNSQDQFRTSPSYNYGTHYSSPGMVYNFLVRLQPFSQQARLLQGGKFDLADRIFSSLPEAWRSAMTEPSDARELTPQFYYLPELLLNDDQLDFGLTQNGVRVHHVQLPPWAGDDPFRFVALMRRVLQQPNTYESLPGWIDLYFGCKQKGQAAVNAVNVYYYLTYEGAVDLQKLSQLQKQSYLSQMVHFGQCPSQLLKEPHPKPPQLQTQRKMALSSFSPLKLPICWVGAGELHSWAVSRDGQLIKFKKSQILSQVEIKRTRTPSVLDCFFKSQYAVFKDQLAAGEFTGRVELFAPDGRSYFSVRLAGCISFVKAVNSLLAVADDLGHLLLLDNNWQGKPKEWVTVYSQSFSSQVLDISFANGLWAITRNCGITLAFGNKNLHQVGWLKIKGKVKSLLSFNCLPAVICLGKDCVESYSLNGQFLSRLQIGGFKDMAKVEDRLGDKLAVLCEDRLLLIECPFLQCSESREVSRSAAGIEYSAGIFYILHSDGALELLRFD